MNHIILVQTNTWIWNILGFQILVDPVLVGNLDFGVPWLYDASKRKLKNFKVLLSIFIIHLGQPFSGVLLNPVWWLWTDVQNDFPPIWVDMASKNVKDQDFPSCQQDLVKSIITCLMLLIHRLMFSLLGNISLSLEK